MELWEQQEREGTRPFAAFTIYRDDGKDRSLAIVSKKVGKSLPLMERWSKAHSWVRRAQAYDAWLDHKRTTAVADEIVAMNKRHVNLAVAMQGILAQRLKSLDPAEVDPERLYKWLDVAARLERLARGEPTSITGTVSADELKQRAIALGIQPDDDPVLSAIFASFNPAADSRKKNRTTRK